MSSSGEMDTAPGNTEANPPWGSLQGIETGGSVKLTTTVLTGLNYQQWANAIEIALEGRGLFEFVTGEFQKPDQTTQTAQYKKWRRLDCQVLTLLQNSIDSKISEIFFNHKTSKDLWDAINKHYGKRTNHSHIYHLKRTVQNTTQNHRTILEYTTDLRRGWEELKIYLPLTSDPKILQERENDQVYQFLGGLDDSYEAIRAQILLSAELPHLDDVMARIQGEETRRLLMVGSSTGQERAETQAMAAAARKPNPKSERGSGNKCDHCKKEGHHKDGCWFLHPNLRPKWWKERPEEERAKNPREKKRGYGAARGEEKKKNAGANGSGATGSATQGSSRAEMGSHAGSSHAEMGSHAGANAVGSLRREDMGLLLAQLATLLKPKQSSGFVLNHNYDFSLNNIGNSRINSKEKYSDIWNNLNNVCTYLGYLENEKN